MKCVTFGALGARLLAAMGRGPMDPMEEEIAVVEEAFSQDSCSRSPHDYSRVGGELSHVSPSGCNSCYRRYVVDWYGAKNSPERLVSTCAAWVS